MSQSWRFSGFFTGGAATGTCSGFAAGAPGRFKFFQAGVVLASFNIFVPFSQAPNAIELITPRTFSSWVGAHCTAAFSIFKFTWARVVALILSLRKNFSTRFCPSTSNHDCWIISLISSVGFSIGLLGVVAIKKGLEI